MSYQRAASASERDHTLDQPAVDLPDSGEHSKEDQHRHEDERQRHLGSEPDAEPNHEQRSEDHARDGVENGHHRLDQLRTEANKRGDDAKRNADGDAERETAERGSEGGFEMRPDASIREQISERRPDPARVRRIHWIEHVGVAGRLPDREQAGENAKLAQPSIAMIKENHAASAR